MRASMAFAPHRQGRLVQISRVSGAPKDISRYGPTRKSAVYILPRPLLGHGPQGYFFTLMLLPHAYDLVTIRDIEGQSGEIGGIVQILREKMELAPLSGFGDACLLG